MSLEVIEVETAANPTATVLWMHGLGADGQDFVPVAQELSLAAVGPVRFVFPNAPVIPVTLNGGYPMRAWYDILGAELTQRQDEQGMRRTQGAINTLIARETARGIAASRIVVAGF
ncbi:MAG: carboxylesterase, partial [Burkholderiales bacterium]|nr:carboxylesterase [Burkholderiales bacterium]